MVMFHRFFVLPEGNFHWNHHLPTFEPRPPTHDSFASHPSGLQIREIKTWAAISPWKKANSTGTGAQTTMVTWFWIKKGEIHGEFDDFW